MSHSYKYKKKKQLKITVKEINLKNKMSFSKIK